MVGAAAAAPTRPATAPPVGASPAALAGRYLFCATQSVNDWSPNRNVAQFPETDCSLYCLVGPNVWPEDGRYTVASNDTVACSTPLVVKLSINVTCCPPTISLAPLGCVGVRVPPPGVLV